MRNLLAAVTAAIVSLGMAGGALANPFEDHLRVKVGVSGVLPDEDADVSVIGGTVDISNEYVPSLQLEWMFSDRISAELLCCVATHEVTALPAGGGSIDLGEVSHFPPTLTLKYRWNPDGVAQPYVGAGVNYTLFFDEDPGAANSIDYDSSIGPALQFGVDFMTADRWFWNLDARRIWINTDVTIDAGPIVNADVDINPWVVSASVGYRF